MGADPKEAAARKQVEEILKKVKATRGDTKQLETVVKQGNTLKGDKDNPH